MRKSSILILAAALVMSAACVKETPVENAWASLTVSISSENPAPLDVKSHLGEVSEGKRKVYWSDGDAICVNGVASNALANLGETASSATFTFASGLGLAPYNILYPADIWADATHVTLPASQTYKAGTFADGMFPMAGYSADGGNISVHHLCAVLKVNILRKTGEDADEHDLVSASFRGLASEQVSGSFTIDYQHATLSGASSADADKAVKVSRSLTTSTSTPVSYYIVVPARTYASGIAIDVQDKGGDLMTLTKSASVTLQAGKLYDMQAVAYEPTGVAPADITITTAEELIAFAHSYNEGTLSGDDLSVALGADITFTDALSAQWNTEGGIGKVGASALFNGLFNGAGHSINGLKASVPLFARVGKNGTVKNLTLGATSSFAFSAAITEDAYLGAIAGYSKGNITDCINNAPVSCTATSYAASIYLGGLVGIQSRLGSISGCTNHAAVTCPASGGKSPVYMGGIVACIQRDESGDDASIRNCVNEGSVSRGTVDATTCQSITHVGGVVGALIAKSGSNKTTIIGLTNTGNVTGPNQESNYKEGNTELGSKVATLVGGIIGGIHGAAIASAAASAQIEDCHVRDCTIDNEHWNNETNYGEADHVGGLIGLSRGVDDGTQNIVITNNCSVENVAVKARRGFAGGLVSWMRGTKIENCSVLTSAVNASAQVFYGGGIAGTAYDAVISGCTVTLTKFTNYNLRTAGKRWYTGGIAGWARGTTVIQNCKAFVSLMYQKDGTDQTGVRGWIVGFANGTSTTIKKCGLGGTYGQNSNITVTLDASNFSDYIYGLSSTGVTVGTGDDANYYWDGTVSTGIFPKRLAIIGDSISTFDGRIPTGHRPYYPKSDCDVTDWTKTYWGHLINDYWHSTLDVNTSWSGSSVASGKEGSVRTPFVDDSRLSLLSNPDCVILFGGTNDALESNGIGLGEFSYDTPLASINHYKRFRDAYIYVIKYIQTNFPSAMIICINGTDITGEYGNSVATIAAHYNLPCVDFRGEKNVAGKVTIYSGSHPDAAGHAYMAQKIYNQTLNLFN